MKICIIGTGATGSVLINTLSRRKEVKSIFCVSRDKKSAKEFIKSHSKIKIFNKDINNRKAIENIAKGSDLIINAASPFLNVQILKLALKIDARYQDLAAHLGFDDGKSKQPYSIEHMDFDKSFKKKGLLALFDTGAAPGLTNLLVAGQADKFGSLDTIKIRLIEDIDSQVMVSTWSPATAIDEIYSRPITYKNRKFKILKRFADSENFKFPKSFGKKATYAIINNEVFTIPQYLDIKNMEVRSAGSDDETARIMVGLGLLEKKNIHISGATITPLEFITKIMPPPPTPKKLKKLFYNGLFKNGYFAFSIEIIPSRHKAKKIWVNFPSQKDLIKRKIYSTYIAYPAGICAAAFALEIPNIKSIGAMPPEGLPRENRKNILKKIKNFGIDIQYK